VNERREGDLLKKDPGQVSEEDFDAESDDAIIGVALRRSAVVALAVAVIVSLGWWAYRQEPAPAPVEEASIAAPAGLTGAEGPAPPEMRFTDVTRAAGIDFVHANGAVGQRLLPETMGGGVVFADLNADRLPDLLFVNSSSWPWTEGGAGGQTPGLYLNNGDGTFHNATPGSGLQKSFYGMGAAVGDVDGDGVPDVFFTAVGTNRLFRNLGGGRFEDVTAQAGVAGDADRWSTSAAFLDIDGDGDLDLFVTNYVQWSRDLDFEVDYRLDGIGRAYGPPTNFPGTQSYLYRNDGSGHFEEIAQSAGIWVTHPDTGAAEGKGLAVAVVDVDADGLPDVLVANDTVRNFYFHNLGGHFEERGVDQGIAYDNMGHATGAMGIDAVRHGETGELAVAIGNFANEMSSYFVDPGGRGMFTDEAIVSGIGPASRQVLSFGLFFFDADLDGRLDLLQANGHVEDDINSVQASQQHAQSAQLFWNCGITCPRRFVAMPAAAVGDLARPMVGRGAAYADMDGDGDLDVVLTQVAGPPRLLRNDQETGHHWLRVRLQGSPPNTGVIGGRVRLIGPDGSQERIVGPTRSYLSQTEFALTFGLGTSAEPVRLEVTWPDGYRQTLDGLPVDTEMVIRKSEAGRS
jgi:hypothetical protein